ncbi:hypothetical protein [Campylobacter concisus]|jgi:hypothetical protein|uniref:hypothetical protein n=1 Tax=Campylobacter concisus TaxID=199 RepID=UPI0011E6158B|nr:hypothetical protein [Campylobacter concisus]
MKKVILALFLLLISYQANANEIPVKMSYYTEIDRLFKVPYAVIEITSLSNDLVIEDIKLNRGNCSINAGVDPFTGKREKLFPMKLQYGNSKKRATTCNKILEAEVITKEGSWTLTWD